MATDNRDQRAQSPQTSRTFRLHGLAALFIVLLQFAIFVGGYFLFRVKFTLGTGGGPIIQVIVFIWSFVAFASFCATPIYLIAGIIQLLTGKRIGMVEAMLEQDDHRTDESISRQSNTDRADET